MIKVKRKHPRHKSPTTGTAKKAKRLYPDKKNTMRPDKKHLVKKARRTQRTQRTRIKGIGNCEGGGKTPKFPTAPLNLHDAHILDLTPDPRWHPTRLCRRRNSYDGPFKWTPTKALAARLLATGEQTVRQVGETMNIHPQTIYFWTTHTKFWKVVEKLILETGLTTEAERAMRIKKRANQIDTILDTRLDTSSQEAMLLSAAVPTDKFISAEAKYLEILERRNKNPEEIHHTFSTLNPDQEKVTIFEDLLKTLSPTAADEIKKALAAKAALLIRKRKQAQEAVKQTEET